MGTTEREFLQKLLATFMAEANDHIQAMAASLMALEQEQPAQSRAEIVEGVFREAHSLKGAARAVNFLEVESLCQSLEGELSDLKRRGDALSPEELDRLHQKVDILAGVVSRTRIEPATPVLLASPENSKGTGLDGSESSAISAPLPAWSIDAKAAQERSREPLRTRGFQPDSVRVSMFKVDSLLRQTEELIPAKAACAHRVRQIQNIHSSLLSWEEEWKKVRSNVRTLQHFLETQVNGGAKPLSEGGKILPLLVRNETMLHSIRHQLSAFRENLETDGRGLDQKVDGLLTNARSLSMLPFSSLLEAFPKLVHDLCRDCGKKAELVVEGGAIEADRRILDEMKDPLMHLVRNCIDHGIEYPDERARKQKPAKARISITLSPQSGGKVEIAVRDDGAGVDIEKVRTAAVQQGILPGGQVDPKSSRELLSLVFQSGVSTSPKITEISGRGLGLAIVQEKVERLGGHVALDTVPGVWTSVRLILPLRMATLRGILVRVGEQVFVFPALHVQRVLRLDHSAVKSAENRHTVQLDGRAILLLRLATILGMSEKISAAGAVRKSPAVLLAWSGEQIVFLVDEIVREQEIIVKNLGNQLARVPNVQGATVLEAGQVAGVLNVAELFRSAKSAAASLTPVHEKPKSILVAEDSITTRTLLKNVLESAGYRVTSAADGAEAFAVLQSQRFDLLVSDVNMPKLNGFELTAKLRADRALSDLPVVLVTALESARDRERGLDTGANAYLVKSSFDQSNLLENVRRLI